MLCAFSILYRIELGGTVLRRSWSLPQQNFQYPLSDRVGWNRQDQCHVRQGGHLSVSSIGSSWVELFGVRIEFQGRRSFSILYRIELGGTSFWMSFSVAGIELSVSSIGSSWVEHRYAATLDGVYNDFQYPLSDRVGWNDPDTMAIGASVLLSVSSIGSSWVELKCRINIMGAPCAFSILYRIELGGTCCGQSFSITSGSFSILYRIELGGTDIGNCIRSRRCAFSILYRIELGGTNLINPICINSMNFQYPLSDRVGWNVKACLRLEIINIFQYPLSDRVGWNFWTIQNDDVIVRFQYPLSDRVGWNRDLRGRRGHAHQLSVSSIGSSWVERLRANVFELIPDLSVSSIGSSWVERTWSRPA